MHFKGISFIIASLAWALSVCIGPGNSCSQMSNVKVVFDKYINYILCLVSLLLNISIFTLQGGIICAHLIN